MSFLRARCSTAALAASAIALSLNCSTVRATSSSNQVVVEAEDVDLAKLVSGGEVVLVSSGKRLTVSHAIDGDRRTIFQFSDSDPRPTLIIKLTDTMPVHRVSVVVGSETRKVEVYLLGEIPRDLSDLDKLHPVGSIVDPGIAREASLDFAPQNAQFVALRWALATNHAHPLAVAEVSVFGTEAADPNAGALAANQTMVDPILDPPVIPVSSP
jgi:hypothetical protein